ncbi:hypothetical protein ACFLRM_07215, partial [Acidobacteriota bacterium]
MKTSLVNLKEKAHSLLLNKPQLFDKVANFSTSSLIFWIIIITLIPPQSSLRQVDLLPEKWTKDG